MRLYLITLEVVPLNVREVYNPLPSHLTLVSRFWSELPPDEIADAVSPSFAQSEPIELVYGDEALVGPKKTAVHLVENTVKLKQLHMQLLEVLTKLKVSFMSPQFVGVSHRPHVSKRRDVQFSLGHKQEAEHAYLAEVEIVGNEHLRCIRAKFRVGS